MGAAIAAIITVVLLIGLGRYIVHLNARKISKSHPRFSMWLPRSTAPKASETRVEDEEKKAEECGNDSLGPFVYISTSDGDLDDPTKEDEDDNDVLGDHGSGDNLRVPRDSLHPNDQPSAISRRFSAPAALEEFKVSTPLNFTGITTSISAPATPNPASSLDRDVSLWIQRQKAAELAQIMRMRITREDMPVHKASPSRPVSKDCTALTQRASLVVNHGLGLVHDEQDKEVDIANTALTALESYSIATDPMSPNIPLTSLFQIDKSGKVVRLSSSRSGSPSPPQDKPVSPSSSGSSSLAEGRSDELESAIIVRMAQARSMEIKRGTLVSMDFRTTCSPPMSHSAPMLLDTIQVPSLPLPLPRGAAKPTNANASGLSSPPPSLSPIIPSATSLSADIEQTLEDRVFAYRDSGEWSKENYKLTTPGQVRALAEALKIQRPVSVPDQTERGWPWPAQRQ